MCSWEGDYLVKGLSALETLGRERRRVEGLLFGGYPELDGCRFSLSLASSVYHSQGLFSIAFIQVVISIGSTFFNIRFQSVYATVVMGDNV
jgi:hypothetical protein